MQFLQFFEHIYEIVLLFSLISLVFSVIIWIDMCCGLKEYNYLDFKFLFFVDGMILGDRCNFLCFLRLICGLILLLSLISLVTMLLFLFLF